MVLQNSRVLAEAPFIGGSASESEDKSSPFLLPLYLLSVSWSPCLARNCDNHQVDYWYLEWKHPESTPYQSRNSCIVLDLSHDVSRLSEQMPVLRAYFDITSSRGPSTPYSRWEIVDLKSEWKINWPWQTVTILVSSTYHSSWLRIPKRISRGNSLVRN